jgi:predicted phage-related endonuclease
MISSHCCDRGGLDVSAKLPDSFNRRHFVGGSDARIIMGQDEKALIRLWQEKRGEVGPEDLSANLIVQLGVATEDLNRVWYERITTKMRFPVLHQ